MSRTLIIKLHFDTEEEVQAARSAVMYFHEDALRLAGHENQMIPRAFPGLAAAFNAPEVEISVYDPTARFNPFQVLTAKALIEEAQRTLGLDLDGGSTVDLLIDNLVCVNCSDDARAMLEAIDRLSKAKYYCHVHSAEHGHESTAWDTIAEANDAVRSIRENANDGITRQVWITRHGRMIGQQAVINPKHQPTRKGGDETL